MEEKERLKGVQANESDLYGSIRALTDDMALYDLVETMLSSIMSDPHGSLKHSSSPIVGTPDELRVLGYSRLGLCLYKHYCAPDAPNPCPERNHDALAAYRCAAVGCLRFFSTQRTRVADMLWDYELAIMDENSPGETIAEYLLLVRLQRRALALFQETEVARKDEEKEEEEEEEDGELRTRRRIFTATTRGTRLLGTAYLGNHQPKEAILLLGEMADIARQYLAHDREFPTRVRYQLDLLHDMTKCFSTYFEETMKAVAPFMVHCMRMADEEEASLTTPLIDQYVSSMAVTHEAMNSAGINECGELKLVELERTMVERGLDIPGWEVQKR